MLPPLAGLGPCGRRAPRAIEAQATGKHVTGDELCYFLIGRAHHADKSERWSEVLGPLPVGQLAGEEGFEP
jgi:hypothetical protein